MTFPNALEWLGAGRLARPHHHLCFHHLHYPVHSNHQLQSLGKLPNQMSRKESSPFYSFCLTQETQQKTGKAFFSGAPGAVDSLESVKFSRGAGCTSLTCLLLFQTVRKQINVTPVCYVFLWNIIDDRIFRNFLASSRSPSVAMCLAACAAWRKVEKATRKRKRPNLRPVEAFQRIPRRFQPRHLMLLTSLRRTWQLATSLLPSSPANKKWQKWRKKQRGRTVTVSIPWSGSIELI